MHCDTSRVSLSRKKDLWYDNRQESSIDPLCALRKNKEMIHMRIFRSCILVVAAAIVVAGLIGCNQRGDKLAQVGITPASQIMAKNSTQQLTANGTFSNGMVLNWTQVVIWRSDDTSIVDVSNKAGFNGLVTSTTNTGTTIITAFDVANNITGTAMITVANPESLQIIPTNPFMPVNGVYPFTAIALFSSGAVTQLITGSASWTSSSPNVATIDNGLISGGSITGLVTASAVTGTTIIQAIEPQSGATGTTILTVTSTPMSYITIQESNPTVISMGTTTQPTLQQFTAIGTFPDGSTTQTKSPGVVASWKWTSSNTLIATIDLHTGLATAVGPGGTLITAQDPISGIVSLPITLTIQSP
jgi:hypothetical protein